MEQSLEEYRRRHEALLAAGAAEYADVLAQLTTAGLPCHFTQTGGMNAAIEVQLETGQTLLLTDAEDSLSWRRAEQLGWGVGLYQASERAAEGATRFASSENNSVDALMLLIAEVLLGRTAR